MVDASLIEAHREPVLRYLTRMLKDAATAEDVVQEVWIRALRNLDSLRDEKACGAWLYRIATHAALDCLRGRKRQVAIAQDAAVDEVAGDDEPLSPLAGLLERAEMSACVQRYIQQLPDDYRAVLFLTELEGLSGPEVAETLGITLATAKIRLHRARQELKTALGDGCCFNHDERGVLVCEPKG
ncbi:MAG TPA: sigma-70 family RNA polymerase sigma factor [Polyangiaceae bacterium]